MPTNSECINVVSRSKPTLFLTTEECFEITSERTKYREDLMSIQEEADIRVLLHAAHRRGSSGDTFKSFTPCNLFVKSSKQTRTLHTDISKVVLALGSQVCCTLPGGHASTACKSVSAFFGKGKVAALKIVRRNVDKSFQNLSQEIGMRWELGDDLLVKLQEFPCMMCTSSLGTSKLKVKQPYLTSITRNSNSTDKPEVDGALILLPPLHQCSFLRVFKAT